LNLILIFSFLIKNWIFILLIELNKKKISKTHFVSLTRSTAGAEVQGSTPFSVITTDTNS
jgi:hypothetical protein